MTPRPDYKGMLTDEDVARLVEALHAAQHPCQFTEEERSVIRDMASGGKLMKKAIIYLFVALALYALVAKSALLKAGQLMGIMK